MTEQEIYGFEFISKRDIPNTDTASLLYKHKVYGCPFIYVKTKDMHNFFACHFRTPLPDNSGVSHMLEHLVLNGSKKYPVRALYSEMKKRSSATFLGAYTYSEVTNYLFSTYNTQDYFNLLDVYLESCFHPLLNEVDFMRECFHVEFENNDQKNQLINCGVVYNETKGMYDLCEHRIQIYLRENLLPDCSERFFHSGIPEFIAKSTVDDVRKYHEKYYHPSNAFFFHYGDIPIEKVLKKVNDVISTFNTCNLKFDINLLKQPKWNEPKTIVVNDAFDPVKKNKNNQYRVLISYLSDSWKDIATFNDAKFLSALLFWGPSSPFGKISYDSTDTSNFIYDDLYNAYIFIYYMCLPVNSVNKVISLIENVLEKAYIEGFEQERYDEVIHKFEIDAHKQSDCMGFEYYSKIIFSSCFGFDPHICLDGSFFIESIHANLKNNPKYYQELIKPLFLDNKHKLTMIVKPVKGFIESINKKITKELAKQKKQLSQKQINQIMNNYIILKESLEKPQPVELLPSLKKSDIQVECEQDEYSEIDENIFVCTKPLNGMTYIRFFLKIDFKHELFNYLPLLTYLIHKVGADQMDNLQLDSYIRLHCSGINFSIHERANPNNCEEGYAEIVASTKCLDRNIEKTIDIFRMIFLKPRLFNPLEIMKMTKNFLDYLNNLNNQDSSSLFLLAKSNLTNSCAIANVLRGPYQINFLKGLIEKNDWFDVSIELINTYHRIFLNAKVDCNIETEIEYSSFIDPIKEIIKSFNESENNQENMITSPVDKSMFQEYKNVFISTESLTNFTLIACKTVSYNDDSNPLYLILSEIMTNEFLIKKIRLEIGAYDVICLFDAQLGIFEIRSFRDPDPFKCLEAYKKALDFCCHEENITDDIVDRAIINVFGYLTPKKESQHRRNIIYNATRQQIVEIAKVLKEKEWNCGILSNSFATKPPEGYTIINLNEIKKTKKIHYVLAIIIIIIILILLVVFLHRNSIL